MAIPERTMGWRQGAARLPRHRPARKVTGRWKRFPNLWCRQQSLPTALIARLADDPGSGV